MGRGSDLSGVLWEAPWRGYHGEEMRGQENTTGGLRVDRPQQVAGSDPMERKVQAFGSVEWHRGGVPSPWCKN